jgi:hypothetical protein
MSNKIVTKYKIAFITEWDCQKSLRWKNHFQLMRKSQWEGQAYNKKLVKYAKNYQEKMTIEAMVLTKFTLILQFTKEKILNNSYNLLW